MKVRNQERDIVALCTSVSRSRRIPYWAYLDRFPPQNEESFCSLCQEARELVHQNVFYLIRLLDLYADPHAVDAWFYQDLLVLVAGHGKWVQQHLRRAGGFNFRHIVSFGGLRCKVRERKGGRERGAHALQVGTE